MTAQTLIHFSKEADLVLKAAAFKKLILPEQPLKSAHYAVFDSGPVGRFEVDKAFIDGAKHYGFTFERGTKPPHDKMVYLSGNSNQKGAEVFESDCWAWRQGEVHPHLEVYFRLWVSEGHRGVVCEPHIWGNCSGGPCHQPTINKLAGFIAESFPETHILIREMANADGPPVIHWNAIGAGGVKSAGLLFDELYGKNSTVVQLANSPLSPFDPNPWPRFPTSETADRLFVPEEEQIKLFKIWREQLKEFKAQLD